MNYREQDDMFQYLITAIYELSMFNYHTQQQLNVQRRQLAQQALRNNLN